MRSFMMACTFAVVCLAFPMQAGAKADPKGGDSGDDLVDLPPEEKAAKIDEMVGEMKGVLKYVLGKLEKARNPPDVVLINCLNDKLTKIKGLLRISEQAATAFLSAKAAGNMDEANHEFLKIAVALPKIRHLKVEAEGCTGEAGQYTGETVVEVEVDQEIESEDETDETETDGDDATIKPQCATPYRPECEED